MSYEVTWGDDIAIVRFTGTVTVTQIIDSGRACQADARFDAIAGILHDCLACEDADFEWTRDLERLQEFSATNWTASLRSRPLRIAVVTDHPRIIEIAKTYESLPLRVSQIGWFKTVNDGLAWIAARGSASDERVAAASR